MIKLLKRSEKIGPLVGNNVLYSKSKLKLQQKQNSLHIYFQHEKNHKEFYYLQLNSTCPYQVLPGNAS